MAVYEQSDCLAMYLEGEFPEVGAMEFYRSIFPEGELDELDGFNKGKYTGIAVEVTKEKKSNGKPLIKRYSVTDDLDEIDRLIWESENFCVTSPISYIGKSRKSENARYLYAMAFDVDGIYMNGTEPVGLEALVDQWSDKVHWLPKPTYIVASGTGIHLYYIYERPVPLFPNVVKQLQKYKRHMTEKIWNRHVTEFTGDKIQQESLFQGFRMVGTVTKTGKKVRAFECGERVTLEYMNQFVLDQKCAVTEIQYKSKLTRAEAAEKYPEWYERRIVKGEGKKTWNVNRNVYEWWKKRITEEAVVGHRYYCMMMLAIYAVKCSGYDEKHNPNPVTQEELEKDAWELMHVFEARTNKETNHFTEKDVLDALQAYEDKGIITYPINSISNRSGLRIEKNKRRKKPLKRDDGTALKAARMIQELQDPEGEWRNKEGRPTAEQKVKEYRAAYPEARKVDCIRATGLDKKTVYKWW